MANKQMYSEERDRLHNMHADSELTQSELKEMEGLLDGIQAWSQEEHKPGSHVKRALMSEMAGNRGKRGFVWLNGFWAWLVPQQKPFHRAPLFQIGLSAACVVLIVVAVNTMGSNEAMEQNEPVALNEEETEKKEISTKESQRETGDNLRDQSKQEVSETAEEPVVKTGEDIALVDTENAELNSQLLEKEGMDLGEKSDVNNKGYKSLESSSKDFVTGSIVSGGVPGSISDGNNAPAPPEGYSYGDVSVMDEVTTLSDQDFEKVADMEEVPTATTTKGETLNENRDVLEQSVTGNFEQNQYFSVAPATTIQNTKTISAFQKDDIAVNQQNKEVYKKSKGKFKEYKKQTSLSLAQSDSEDFIDLLYTAE